MDNNMANLWMTSHPFAVDIITFSVMGSAEVVGFLEPVATVGDNICVWFWQCLMVSGVIALQASFIISMASRRLIL
jgi:hypothetical protein